MNAKDIVKGMRPKTLVAAIVPVICAYALAFAIKDASNIYAFLCMLLALFIQIATNFYNDAIDFKKGADKNRIGEARIATQGGYGHQKVMLLGHLFLILTVLISIPLFLKGGWVIGLLGAISLFFAYGYTGGPFPLAYIGLGELFVFIFFGLVATTGSFYLITSKTLSLDIFVIACQIGFLSSVLIAINNYRDKDEDIKVNKKTLATRMSRSSYLKLINVFLFVPYILTLYWVFFVDQKYIINLLSVGLAHQIRSQLEEITDLTYCNVLLAKSGKHLAIFSILFVGITLWK